MKNPLRKIHQTVLTGLITAAAIATSIPAMAVDVPIADDAHVYQLSPANNFGVTGTLQVLGSATQARWSYMKFNVASFVPAGTTPDDIAKVTLRLFPSTITAAGQIGIHNVTGAWVEGKKNNTAGAAGDLTWASKPGEEAIADATFTLATTDADEFIAFDITDLVKEWLATPPVTANYGIVLKPTTGSTVNVSFDAKESTANSHQPTLDITFSKKIDLSSYNQPGSFTALSATTVSATNVIATNVSGDGAGLTNLAAGNITGLIGSSQLNPSLTLNGVTSFTDAIVLGNHFAVRALPNNTGYANLFIGDQAGTRNLGNSYNTAIGYGALFGNFYGYENTAVGAYALYSALYVGGPATGGGHGNTAVGAHALQTNSGEENTAVGKNALFSNRTGYQNTATGFAALWGNTTGGNNTAFGALALSSNSSGHRNNAFGHFALYNSGGGIDNCAFGESALFSSSSSFSTAMGNFTLYSNTTGEANDAFGGYALYANTIGHGNVALGWYSLNSNTVGYRNCAHGQAALRNNTTGSYNLGLGYEAGSNLTTGSNNISIVNPGVAGESNAIRIGTQGTHTLTAIAGISGATSSGGVAVYINSNGVLGTLTSSARFKQNIADMEAESSGLLKLRPVTFEYKPEYDSKGIPQFGLIAEEVDKIDSRLVVRDDKGEIYTVRYEQVNAMLLNEFLKDHRRLSALSEENAALKKQFATFGEEVAAMKARDEAREVRLAKLEATSPAAPVTTSTAAIEAK